MSDNIPENVSDNRLANEKSMRKFLTTKYIIDLITLSVTLGAIFLSAYMKVIDSCTAGTLFGVTIGYCLKGFRKLHK